MLAANTFSIAWAEKSPSCCRIYSYQITSVEYQNKYWINTIFVLGCDYTTVVTSIAYNSSRIMSYLLRLDWNDDLYLLKHIDYWHINKVDGWKVFVSIMIKSALLTQANVRSSLQPGLIFNAFCIGKTNVGKHWITYNWKSELSSVLCIRCAEHTPVHVLYYCIKLLRFSAIFTS